MGWAGSSATCMVGAFVGIHLRGFVEKAFEEFRIGKGGEVLYTSNGIIID